MTNVGEHIQSTDEAIGQNIDALTGQRALLSQNLLAQLRNLVEGVAMRLQTGSLDAEYNYAAIGLGLAFIRGKGQYGFLGRFHKLLEASASHYTMDGDASERLMLKYYEYLLRIRRLLRDRCGIAVLANLERFPVDLDRRCGSTTRRSPPGSRRCVRLERAADRGTGTTSTRRARSSWVSASTTRSPFVEPLTGLASSIASSPLPTLT
jgi:hypothetical protein